MAKKAEAVAAPTTKKSIQYCGCVGKPSHASEYQDKTYGKGMRLHTVSGSKTKVGYSCTVCGKER